MNHWMCDDQSPVLPLRDDLHQMCDGRLPEPKGDHSLVSQKGSNYFLWVDPNTYLIAFIKVKAMQGYTLTAALSQEKKISFDVM